MQPNWKPTKLDLLLSSVIVLVFPFLAGFLFARTGALLPMIMYYSLAWGLSIWRRGGSGYHFKKLPNPPGVFYINVLLILVTVVFSYFIRSVADTIFFPGVIFTALIWAVANASSEQLLWLYIFDSWDLYKKEELGNLSRFAMRIVGLILFSVFVGTIHTLFWAKFLHTVNPESPLGPIFIVGTSLSGYLHILVWRKKGEMLYTFIPHYMLNLFPLFFTGYSILPYLLN